ncbi:MAG: hypothetical protein WB762_17790 [Candidatus Sulfotelmatobacter sp.]
MGRNVGIVTSEGEADVAVGADQIVGRVEGGPWFQRRRNSIEHAMEIYP